MTHPGFRPSRRTLMKIAGSGIAAGALAELGPGAAAAQPADAGIWSAEYRAKKEDVSLYLFRKRLGAPAKGLPERPVLFLVHGSSVSSRPTFDLTVPGKGEYSLMNVFAGYGFDVWTMDHEGYGRSTRTEGNSDIRSGAEDLAAGSAVVARETGRQGMHLMGESSGALRAAVFAAAHPERVDRLVLMAFTYTGAGSPTLQKRADQLEYFRTHNRRKRDREMIRSIFSRDKPGTADPAVAEAMADSELPFGETVPTGTYLDMTANLPVVDPAKVLAPTLVVRGEHDGIATEQDLLDFYRKLPSPDRQFSILPGLAHSLALGVNRRLFWHCARAFLEMPRATPI
ncbi:MAG TPA: alpha/beta fold hydrolase [Myxococcales bacterium]|nr:alpha/beta fold hydrolase [Myxococcales bacterium]